MSHRRAAGKHGSPLAARAAALLVAGLLAAAATPPASAQAPPSAAAPAGEQLILTLLTNGVARGEFTLLRQPDGDFWVLARDLPRLQLTPVAAAARQQAGEAWFSFRALGASSVRYDEAELALAVDFAAENLAGNRIDLSGRQQPLDLQVPRSSLILSYRLASRDAGGVRQTVLDNDLNLRLGGVLLRQETRVDSYAGQRFTRGRTQAIWDDVPRARRYIAGDVFSSAGTFGSAITGGGLLLAKLYDLAPEVVRQPTATLRASTTLPAQVEVAVDGSVVHRASVGPGPITVDNVLLYGGARTVRVTVTDVTGRREVFEQPFLFTDSVLAEGLHEYSYFVGRRSELDLDNRLRYTEPAAQFFHRYGVNDALTVSAGGEAGREFATGGAGVTLRSDRLGLFSLELLANRDHQRAALARGWQARYTYLSPLGSVLLSQRQFENGFRTFTTSERSPYLERETRVGLFTQWGRVTLAADLVHARDALDDRWTRIVRVATNIGPATTLSAELQSLRSRDLRDWSAYLFLRHELEARRWVAATARATSSGRGFDLETGRQVEGEGLAYRAGTSTNVSRQGETSSFGFASAEWNLRPATLELYAGAPIQGAGGRFTEIGVSGALVAIDGAWGLTRRVDNSFALARLGVPQAGVEVFLNNQLQGTTDARGLMFLPQVGAFSRQDVSVNDKQVDLQYNLAERRRTITPAYRAGLVVDFGGRKLSAVAGTAWMLVRGERQPVVARAWTLRGTGGELRVETGTAGDFYLENAPAGSYAGTLDAGGRTYACRMTIPVFAEAVHELAEGILCE